MFQWLLGRNEVFYQACIQGWLKLLMKMETKLKKNYAFSNAIVKLLDVFTFNL